MADESFYSAHWRESGTDCHVSASQYGVSFSWSTAPHERDGWGESYTWERWYAEGKARGGGPSDMLARIEAVGRFLGHAPKPAPASHYDRRVEDASEREAQQQRYLKELQRQAAHSTPETLIVSRRQFEKLRKLALQRAQILWDLLCPGTPVKRGHPSRVQEGTRIKRFTEFSVAGSGPGYTLVETEDRFEGEAGVSVWYSLRVQCALSNTRQFGIWFVDGQWQLEIIVADEASVERIGNALRQAHPEWGKDPTLCGAVRAFVYTATRNTMFNRCFGHTGPTRLAEQHGNQLWPVKPSKAPALGRGLPKFRPWSAQVKRILGFAFDADADATLKRRAIDSGLHWIVPIGTTTSGCWLGLRRLPQLPLERCPVLLCHGVNAVTVATELRDSLAQLVSGNSLQYLAACARIMGKLDPAQADYRNHVVALSETPGYATAHGRRGSGVAAGVAGDGLFGQGCRSGTRLGLGRRPAVAGPGRTHRRQSSPQRQGRIIAANVGRWRRAAAATQRAPGARIAGHLRRTRGEGRLRR